MSDEKREWKTEPVKKFGDLASPQERSRRNLPAPGLKYVAYEDTEELRLRREVDGQFRIKRTK